MAVGCVNTGAEMGHCTMSVTEVRNVFGVAIAK